MKDSAKCPWCQTTNGCEQCGFTGYIKYTVPVEDPANDVYVTWCDHCNKPAGGVRITGPGLPALSDPPNLQYAVCVHCYKTGLRYVNSLKLDAPTN